MSTWSNAYTAGAVTAIVERPLAPGVLTNVTLSLYSAVTKYGDLHAEIHIASPKTYNLVPFFSLSSGILCSQKPLSWTGEYSITENSLLVYVINGYAEGIVTMSWSRATETSIKEIGQYARAIFKLPDEG